MLAMPQAPAVAAHAALLVTSYCRTTGRDLIDPCGSVDQTARALWEAPFVVASHGTQDDPVFNYGNRAALALFEMTWDAFITLPSRLSAEPLLRDERDAMLARVREFGFIDDYNGVRVSARGKRFRIRQASVWTVRDTNGVVHGQAVVFNSWEPA